MTPKKLYCDNVFVGELIDTQFSDFTWFAFIKPVTTADDPAFARIREYITFCEDWSDRTIADPMNGPDATEFDEFDDITKHANWFIETESGEHQPIDLAPVFWGGNELSWRPLEEET